MFTLQQIHEVHSKVKTGADFPNYVRDMKLLGVLRYHAYVQDGHCEYQGENGYTISSAPLYDEKKITDIIIIESFTSNLKKHQQGLTDYFTFCEDCAVAGVTKWLMDLENNVCIYYDKQNREVLRENIPV